MTALLTAPAATRLPTRQLNLMRVGYLLMGLGLAIVKWPLVPRLDTMPLQQGLVTCLLVALSLLALAGLRHPVAMLPVLLFEGLWKLLWLGAVALPTAARGDIEPAMQEVAVNCSLVVVVLAVIPWPHVWQQYVIGPGDPWR